MKFTFLGTTGLKVSRLCMGTMTFGREADKAAARAIFKRCRDAGINFFDCANTYSEGQAETILGELIADRRDELIITSKVAQPMGAGLNDRGGSRRHIMAAVEASLRRLQTSYIDLYFLHQFDPHTPLEESLRALDDLVSQGKVHYLGASNFAAWQIAKALGVSALYGWTAFQCIQPMYNLVKRQAEVEILPLAQSENLGVISYSPLGGGLLTGKYGTDRRSGSGQLTDRRSGSGRLQTNKMYQKRYGEDWMFAAANGFKELADTHGYHPVSLAVSWVAHHPAVTAPIIGARDVAQLEDALKSVDIELTSELYDQICRLTLTPPPATDRSEEVKATI
ncbi:MAG: aldo/keto reductase [Desulfobacterales bacterium]|nr:MAG: aldo/keto reductase [Desulfobacterales bacterium]